MSTTLEELTKLVMEQAKEKGFGTTLKEISVPEKIALIHSQISSAYEGYRKNKLTGEWSLENELAGAVIIIIQLYAVMDLDFEKSLLHKIEEIKGRKWGWEKLNQNHS